MTRARTNRPFVEIPVSEEAFDYLELLCDRWDLHLDEVIERLLDEWKDIND